MFKTLSVATFLQPSLFSMRTMTHQGKFFFRKRHQVDPQMKMRDLRPIAPPGNNLELPSSIWHFIN